MIRTLDVARRAVRVLETSQASRRTTFHSSTLSTGRCGRAIDAPVDGEVRAMPGAFYGGWITSRIVGPFKGAPGTQDW